MTQQNKIINPVELVSPKDTEAFFIESFNAVYFALGRDEAKWRKFANEIILYAIGKSSRHPQALAYRIKVLREVKKTANDVADYLEKEFKGKDIKAHAIAHAILKLYEYNKKAGLTEQNEYALKTIYPDSEEIFKKGKDIFLKSKQKLFKK